MCVNIYIVMVRVLFGLCSFRKSAARESKLIFYAQVLQANVIISYSYFMTRSGFVQDTNWSCMKYSEHRSLPSFLEITCFVLL